jgi:hypothetical protein
VGDGLGRVGVRVGVSVVDDRTRVLGITEVVGVVEMVRVDTGASHSMPFQPCGHRQLMEPSEPHKHVPPLTHAHGCVVECVLGALVDELGGAVDEDSDWP